MTDRPLTASRITALACVAAGLVALGTGSSFAAEVTRTATFEGDPARVWELVAPFCSIGSWHPAAAGCTDSVVDGKERRLIALKGGGEILEELVARDDAQRFYTYRIVESPLPVENYLSTLTIGDGLMTWSGNFTAKGATDEEAQGIIGGIYVAGFEGIGAALD